MMKITKKDVGKKVTLRNGNTDEIIGLGEESYGNYPVETHKRSYTIEGRVWKTEESEYDIIQVFQEGDSDTTPVDGDTMLIVEDNTLYKAIVSDREVEVEANSYTSRLHVDDNSIATYTCKYKDGRVVTIDLDGEIYEIVKLAAVLFSKRRNFMDSFRIFDTDKCVTFPSKEES